MNDIEGLILPTVPKGYYSSWAQYTIQLPKEIDRKMVQDRMKELDIPTMVYYTKPMHRQGAFLGTESASADCPITEELCRNVLCLPIHPYLENKEIEDVVLTLVRTLQNC